MGERGLICVGGEGGDEHHGEHGKKDAPQDLYPVDAPQKDEKAGNAEGKEREGFVDVGDGRVAGDDIPEDEGEEMDEKTDGEKIVRRLLQAPSCPRPGKSHSRRPRRGRGRGRCKARKQRSFLHPFHSHDCSFYIIHEEGATCHGARRAFLASRPVLLLLSVGQRHVENRAPADWPSRYPAGRF